MLTLIDSVLALPILGAVLKLLILIALVLVVRRALSIAVRAMERRLEAQVSDVDRRRRLDTLLRAGEGAAIVLIVMIAVFTALDLIGLNIGPLLASAGVAGLAISLGATTMIQDYIGGMIILAEDQFRVGDVIEVSGVSGEVVRMTMRATYLRDGAGKLYTVPNGSVRLISNLTREWARAMVDLTLVYETDFAKLGPVLEHVSNRLKADPTVAEFLLGDVELIRWNSLTEWGVQVRLMVKTQPGKQWAVNQALRGYTLEAVQAQGLHIAFPIRTIGNGGQVRKPAA